MSNAEFIILGSAQDGGLPHAGCLCVNCRSARSDASFRRLPASAGIVDGDHRTLIDATSAFEHQSHLLWERTPASRNHAAERYAAPDVVILTHAHTGHYAGIWQLDRSVLAARGTRVLSPPRMHAFLSEQEPWAGMVRDGFIVLEALPLDTSFSLSPNVQITALDVPHRAEWDTDTVALIIEGPNKSILYLPDIDRWDEWNHDIRDVISGVVHAFIDGCFWMAPPRRNVPHPPVSESLDLLQTLADTGKQISFIHLNHSNPLCDPASSEHQQVTARGFHVGRDGQTASL